MVLAADQPRLDRSPGADFTFGRIADRELVDLVDALVAAIDRSRTWEVEQVQSALAPFGASALFDYEFRLNGTASLDGCICQAEGWL